jgi:hypothetical protein
MVTIQAVRSSSSHWLSSSAISQIVEVVRLYDVQDTIVIDEPAEAPEMTVELLLLLIIAILVDIAHHDESTGVQMARRLC